jgi:hypothetical protein
MVWRIPDNLRHPGSFRKVDLVPVLLGNGIPFFANPPLALEGPRVTEGAGLTHLHYRLKSTSG